MSKFTDTEIESINSAIDHIARIPSAIRHATPLDSTTQEVMARIHISCCYCPARTAYRFGRSVTQSKVGGWYFARCELAFGLDCHATGHTPIAAYRRLFKALAARAALNDRRIRVPLSLSHPAEARRVTLAERKARAEAEALAEQQRQIVVRAAPTTIITAPTPTMLEGSEYDLAAECTEAWHAAEDGPNKVDRVADAIEQAMRGHGLEVSTERRAGASSPITVHLSDSAGDTTVLEWDPMQDSFDITESTCLADE